jgi:beta-glucanase (GH16 family)
MRKQQIAKISDRFLKMIFVLILSGVFITGSVLISYSQQPAKPDKRSTSLPTEESKKPDKKSGSAASQGGINSDKKSAATTALAASKPGWNLVFEDEFDTDSLTAANSSWMTGYYWGQTNNDELQYYTRFDKNFSTNCSKGGANHIFSSGSLILRAKVETGNYEMWNWDSHGNLYTTCKSYQYTSGMIHSKQSYLYGYFEMRARIPNLGITIWPAFWLYSGGTSPSQYREIDIFEFSSPFPNRVGTNVHIARQLEDMIVNPPNTKDNNNSYPDHFDITYPPNVTDGFHTYAVKWTPNSITWYADDNLVRTLTGHTPHLPMNVIANLAIAPGTPPNVMSYPQDFEIDYIRVYRSPKKEFIYDWGNQGNGKFHVWNINPTDKYAVGDFDGDGKDELLAINPNGAHQTMKFVGGNWNYIEGGSNGKIHVWNINYNDRYLTGDFDSDGKDELLAINPNGAHQTMKFNGANWVYIEGGGNGKIHVWNINATDKYVAGDFNGDGRDELLATNFNGAHHTMQFIGGAWNYIEGGGNGKIDVWNINGSDKYVAGDFDGDKRDELLAINPNGWHHTMKFDGANWKYIEGSGNGKINWWNIAAADQFLVADFQGNKRDQLVAVSNSGWSHLMEFSGSGWSTDWINDGANTIDRWKMRPIDVYIAGSFDLSGGAGLLSISAVNGYSHLMKYTTNY